MDKLTPHCLCACSALTKHKHGLMSLHSTAVECRAQNELSYSRSSICINLLHSWHYCKSHICRIVKVNCNLNAGLIIHFICALYKHMYRHLPCPAFGLVGFSMLCLHRTTILTFVLYANTTFTLHWSKH